MLTHTQVKSAKPGTHSDSLGLYLVVQTSGARSWIYRYTLNGKRRMMGLGSVTDVTLSEARDAASAVRKQVKEGIDPVLAKKESAQITVAAPTKRFKEWAAEYIDSQKASWKNDKHIQQWTNTLRDYAYPVIGNIEPVNISKDHILSILTPNWSTKNETMSRVRGRIESVLDYAFFHLNTDRANPARFKGFLDKALPAPSKVKNQQHFAALPYADVADFMHLLATVPGHSARCLEFTILTACRSGEALGATWDEIDVENKVWNIPASRMKMAKPHRVALSAAALKVLEGQRGAHATNVFPGWKKNTQLSNMSMTMILRKLKVDATVHGFRSSFRDWAAEQTEYPNEVAEMALAHSVGSKVESAYRRGDLLEKRYALANDWAAFIAPKQ